MTFPSWTPPKGTLIHASCQRFERQDIQRVDLAQLQPTSRPIEDRFSVHSNANDLIFGVYDGHGGNETADYISKELPPRVSASFRESTDEQSHSSNVTDECLELDRELHNAFTKTFGFIRSLPFQDRILSALLGQHRHRIKAQRAKAGSTALLARISCGCMDLINVGDCRAIITVRDHDMSIKTEQLTNDQNPYNAAEVERLRSEHPGEDETVIMHNRVLGRVGATRTFGDVYYKERDTWFAVNVMGHTRLTPQHGLSWKQQSKILFGHYRSPPYLTAKPEVSEVTLIPRSFVVMASDGLWSLVKNEWVSENLWKGIDEGVENLSLYLLQRLYQENLYPGDDVTILVLRVA
ncbi:protein serine/threonine phosphatase 2C [Marasmius fiardii PR-910]|nr:protein serine/threonine phosphatase 2C [Marasmius fiardii PR-910]